MEDQLHLKDELVEHERVEVLDAHQERQRVSPQRRHEVDGGAPLAVDRHLHDDEIRLLCMRESNSSGAGLGCRRSDLAHWS